MMPALRGKGFLRLGRAASTAGLAFSVSGCFTWTVVDPSLAPVGEEVRVVTTRAGGQEILEATGRDRAIPQVEGRLISAESGSLEVRIPIGSPMALGPTGNLSQIVRIPVSEVLSMEERRFNRGRTIAAVGGSTALAALLVISIMDGFGSGEGIDPGDEVLSRSPRPSIRLSLPVGGPR
jgi:hypothetical protein